MLSPKSRLLLAEGHAVSTLIHSRVTLVGANQDLIQGAIVLAVAMVCAVLDGAFNALVCMAIHNPILLLV